MRGRLSAARLGFSKVSFLSQQDDLRRKVYEIALAELLAVRCFNKIS